MVSIQINDDAYLDLQREFVGLNYQIADIGSIDTRTGTFSNDFNIPNTAHNRSALGFASVDNVIGTYTPYTGIPAKVFQNNIMISRGVIQVNNSNKDEIDITFFGDNIDVFELIRGKQLRDCNLSSLQHTYTAANITASFNNTSGYIYPVLDYGNFRNRSSNEINSGEIFPAIFVPDIMTAIFNDIGYKIHGTMLDRALYKKSFVPFVNEFFGYSKDFVDSKNYFVTGLEANNSVTAGSTVLFNFDTKSSVFQGVIYDNDLFNLSSDRYTADNNYTININFIIDLREFIRDNGLGAARPTLSIKKNGVVLVTGVASSTFLTTSTTVTAGDYIECFVKNNHSATVTMRGTSSGNVSQKFIEGSVIYPETVLPDMTQVDFVKWALFRFLGVLSVDQFSKTVYFNQFNDLKNNDVDDWSNKIDLSKKIDTNYSKILSNYAKKNIAQYTVDENDIEQATYNGNNDYPFGSGVFTLDNDFLENEKIIFETPFSPTFLIESFQNDKVLIPFIPRHIEPDIFIDFVPGDTGNSGGNVAMTIPTCPEFNAGSYIEISNASRTEYNGVWLILTKVDQTTFILQLPWLGSSSGVLTFFFEQKVNIPEPRVLTLYNNINISQFSQVTSLDIMGTVVESIPFTYFYKSTLGFQVDDFKESLAFGNQNIFAPNDLGAIESDYLSLIAILQNPVIKKAYLRINQIDLSNLNFLKKKYIERFGGYFYLNIIEDYDGSGDSVKCELVKVN